jgi:hypothetical protein
VKTAENTKPVEDKIVKTRSPQCPSISLKEAIEKTDAIYEKEKKHPVANEAVAKSLGYKSANNGAAARMMASLSYYGLLNKAGNGKLSVSPDFEKYSFAPNGKIRQEFLTKWIHAPKIFSEVIGKYGYNLPSDNALKYDLIERGFKPDTADNAVSVLRDSIHFLLENSDVSTLHKPETEEADSDEVVVDADDTLEEVIKPTVKSTSTVNLSDDFDVFPVRLHNNRQAAIHLPRPFNQKDREIIKRQLDAILADDE